MRLLISAAALFWLSVGSAQPHSLDSVLADLGAHPTLRGNFDQTREIPGLSRPLHSTGSFVVSDAGLYWAQATPFEFVLIADESRLIQKVLDQPPVELDFRSQPIAASIGSIFVGIVTGQRALLERNFVLSFSSGSDGWAIGLVPRSEVIARAIESIEVRGAAAIAALEIRGAGGDRVEIGLSDLRAEPAQLTDAERALYQP